MAKTKVKPKNATSKSDVWYKVLTVVIIVCLLQSPVFRAKVLSIFASKAAKGGVQ